MTDIDQIAGEHGEMFVEKVDGAIVNALGDGLADLVRTPALDHVQAGPAVLRLGARRGSDEERVAQLALQVVLLDVVGQEGGHFPVGTGSALSLGVRFVFGGHGGRVAYLG